MRKSKQLTMVNSDPDNPPNTRPAWPAELDRLSFGDLQTRVLAEDEARQSTSMRLALLVRYIHDTKRYHEDGHETFEEWCESIDRTKVWGHYLVKAADHAGRVENPRQARALTGLSSSDADTVVEAAKGAGPVTAGSLTSAREELERRRAETVKSNRDAVKQIEEGVYLKRIVAQLNKAKLAGQQHGGMPEKFFKDCEKWIAYCTEQRSLAA